VAAALCAEKLIHLTDVEGIKGPGGDLISTLSQTEARRLVVFGFFEEVLAQATVPAVRRRLEHALEAELAKLADEGDQAQGEG